MKIWMFPGQGSQIRGMGDDLFSRFPKETKIADDILGYSIEDLCLNDPDRKLKETDFTQPALFVTNALKLMAVREDGDGTADYTFGHSLGEFNALFAAGAIDFETGVELVQERGRLMAKAPPGGMAAIIDLNKEQVETALRQMGNTELQIANYNSPNQFVISGPKEQIQSAEAPLSSAGGRYVILNTGGAFHSPLMAPAQAEFAEFVREKTFRPTKIPVISNVTARPHGDQIADQMIEQITAPVRWCDSVEYLLTEAGEGDISFEEIGPGRVLTGLVMTIRKAFVPQTKPQTSSATTGTSPAEKVAQWNAKHQIGTLVDCSTIGLTGLRTRTEAMLIFPHRAGLYVENHEGYFDIDELSAR